MEVRVLGPIEVCRARRPVDLGTPKQRAVLAALTLARGQVVSVDRIADLVWGEEPPRAVAPSVQAYVSQLRRALEPRRSDAAAYSVLATRATGYALQVPERAVDAHRFESAVTALHRRARAVPDTGPTPLTAKELEHAERGLAAALGGWRGSPYVDLGDAPAATVERHRLENLRALASEDQAAVWLALGDHARAAVHLEALTGAYPLRERLWVLRAVALARSGRQAEALDVLAALRRVLDEELGLEPSTAVQRLQTAVLRQDDALAWQPPPQEVAVRGPAGPGAAGVTPRRWPVPPRDPDTWPTFERDDEAAQLDAALGRAARGSTTFAVVTGEAGSGRTRLVSDLAGRAAASGFQVCWGRCSQDEDAPPLLPWRGVLASMGRPFAEPGVAGGGHERFGCWQRVVHAVVEAAEETPLLIALDDLHWADRATLRVLRLLVESAGTDRVLVVASWRSPHARPTEPLGDIAANLGRRHAVRIELSGLSLAGTQALHTAVAGRPTTDDEARALFGHTRGNPYLVTEYAHAVRRSGVSVAEVVASPPTAVVELVARRLALLPVETLELLRAGAVLGDELDVDAVALATGAEPGEVLDRLDPARLAGFLEEVGVDRFRFASAVVRDTLRQQVPLSRAARLRRGLAAPAHA